MKKSTDRQTRPRNPFEILESRVMMSVTPTVHDGGGTQLLSSSMVQSGTANDPNVYQNYLVRSELNLTNISNVTITKCDIGGWGSANNGIFVNTISNVSIVGNTFHNLPSSNGIGANATNIVDCHFDDNTFEGDSSSANSGTNYVCEPIHLDFGLSGTAQNDTINGNVFQTYRRNAIEIQGVSSGGLQVDHNYIGVPMKEDSHMAMSIATGDNTTIPGAKTSGNEIAYNTVLGSSSSGTTSGGAIENYGSGTNIHDNYITQWGSGIFWNWTGLDGNVSWHETNNTFVGCGTPLAGSEGFGTAAQNIQPTQSGNQIFAGNAANAPAAPSIAQTTDGANTATPTPTPTVAPTFTATAGSDGVDLTLPAGGGTLTWTATGNSGSPLSNPTSGETHTTVIPAGTTTFVDTSVPNNWQVYYTFSGSPGGVLLTTQTSQSSAATPTATPTPTVTTAPVTSNLTATAQANGVHLTLPAGGGTLTWTATGNTGSPLVNPTSAETNSITIAAGTTNYVDTSVPNNWEVYYTFSGAAGQSALVRTVTNQVFSTTSSTPPVVSSTPGSDGSSSSVPVSTSTGSDSSTPANPVTTAGWTNTDLGSTVSAGSSSVTGGVFTIDSPVADTTQSPVASHFVYQSLGQKSSITVHLSEVEGTAGLKLASDLQSGDPTASLMTDASGNVTFATQGATSASSSSGSVQAKGDTWLKLVRNGSRVIGYASSDGATWQKIGSANLNLPNSVDAGMAVSSQTNGAGGSAQFSNVAVNGAASSTGASTPTVSADKNTTPMIGAGNGLKAQMYSNISRAGKAVSGTDAAVNFNWGQATPNTAISSTPYSVRWTGNVEAEYSDVYTLSVNSDSGVKLFVNGSPVIHDWQKTSTGSQTGTVAMEAGKQYHVRLVYGEKGDSDSNVSLNWSSDHQTSEVIPQSQLFSDAA